MNSAVAELPNINDVPRITESDRECFEAVRQTLVKHGCERRFGLTLLHQHFPVAADEIMLETNDPTDRTLLMRPVKASELAEVKYRETQWRLDGEKATMSCACHTDSKGNHNHFHHK